ncbi:MAG: metallophosphoesterase family protein [Verrucomicrobiae bacterium]|nr:metallophosphoesterase family protein [Verrucomicrobiae bacterium]
MPTGYGLPMFWRWLWVGGCLFFDVAGDELFLVRVGDEWRHAQGGEWLDIVSDDWRQPGYDDRTWMRGVSGFAFNPYSYEATTLSGFDAGRCHVFRCRFHVADTSDIAWLILRVDYSGGFVAWINGNEVARRGLTGRSGEPVAWNAPAQPRTRGVPEEIDLSDRINLLVQGDNVLAIQWHHAANSYSYGTALVAELLANFTRGPAVQNTSTSATTITWKTHVEADSKVEYGVTPDLGCVVHDPALTQFHELRISGLEPDTLYYYRVSSRSGGKCARSPVFAFRTLRESGPFSFAVMADMGLASVGQYKVADVIRRAGPDIVLVAGDLVYPTYTAGREDFRFFSVYGPHMRSTAYFVVAGNHDTWLGSASDFFRSFAMPTNDVPAQIHTSANTGPAHYYSFDHGDAHFVGLYVPLMVGSAALTAESPQFAWLTRDLAASQKPWKFIFLHHPVISSDGHRNDDYNGNGILDVVELGNLLFPVARSNGVQMIISGHDHVYTKFNPIGGVYAVVSGSGGGPIYSLSQFDPATSQFWARYECIKVSGNADELCMEALAEDGTVFDKMYIRRGAISGTPFMAAWGTPCVEDQPANDGDGNVVGQKFDFAGTPIPTISGNYSNLGRLWVNRDHEHLYLGFEQVMLYPWQVIFVFIEVPGRMGVSSLEGLGNGVVDPMGQGVDGLDFAENLSFKGFRPSVGCVLGDEYADGQSRSGKRP